MTPIEIADERFPRDICPVFYAGIFSDTDLIARCLTLLLSKRSVRDFQLPRLSEINYASQLFRRNQRGTFISDKDVVVPARLFLSWVSNCRYPGRARLKFKFALQVGNSSAKFERGRAKRPARLHIVDLGTVQSSLLSSNFVKTTMAKV